MEAAPVLNEQCYRVPVRETRVYTIRVRAHTAAEASAKAAGDPAGWAEILPGETVERRTPVETPVPETAYDEAEAAV